MGLSLTKATSFLSKTANHLLNKDGHIQAPPLTFKTSEIGSQLISLRNSLRQNKTGKAISDIFCKNPNVEEVQNACKMFEKETGIKMFVTNPTGAISFNSTASTLMQNIKDGTFPKDIKHIIVGHGSGTVLNNTWHVAYSPEIKIFDFIKQNIPKGEKVLVVSCEETPKELRHLIPKDKPAIGNYVTELYSSFKHPAKIVESGKDEIIGGYGNGIATYYK